MRDKQLTYTHYFLLVQHLCFLLSAVICASLGIWLWESGKVSALYWQEFLIICIAAGLLISYLSCVLVLNAVKQFCEMHNESRPHAQSALHCASTLRKYKELLDANAITAEEYEAIKHALLRQIEK